MLSGRERNQIVQEVHREFLRAGRLSLPPNDIRDDDDYEFWGEVERRLAEAEARDNFRSVSLGPRFDRALALASELHRDQIRKGSEVPYIGHLLGVAAIVIDDGGSEDEAIAALLHDAAEDQGGEATLDRIEEEFGADVRQMVDELSDTLEEPKPPWRERKEAYLAHLAEALPGTKRISLADKLYNARAIVSDHRRVGDEVWERFRASRKETLWYYRSLAEVFGAERPGPLAEEFQAVVEEMGALSG